MNEPETARTTLVPSGLKPFALASFGLPEATVETLTRLSGSASGCLILIHGASETGKTSLAVSLSEAVGKNPFFLNTGINEGSEVIQEDLDGLIGTLDSQTQTLVIDDDEDFLNSKSPFSESFQRLWLDNFIARNRHSILWITSAINEIPPRVLGLFDYVLELTERTGDGFQWPSQVPPGWHGVLSRFLAEPVGNLRRAIEVWDKTALPLDSMEVSLGRLVDLLKRRTSEDQKGGKKSPLAPISRAFDPALWNTDIPLTEISKTVGRYLEWIKRNPEQRQPFAILASGPPGTGKTEFAKAIARDHGKELKVHRYSDIVSPFVGATEQMISKAFNEASPGDFVLLDEVDSLLVSRSIAKHSWERSATNEILTQLENFPGVLVACTNLLSSLDVAVARRFTAKITFSPLRYDQVERAWEAHFPGVQLPVNGLDELAGRATPGDFRIVANGLQFRERTADSLEVLDLLRFEQETKRRVAGDPRKIGFHG